MNTNATVPELIRACIDSADAAAWEEFVRRFHGVIAATVFKSARRFGEMSSPIVDDLVQDTYLKICANQCRILREFDSRHPDAIFGLLKTVAFSVVQDYFRSALAEKRGSGRQHQELDPGIEQLLPDGTAISGPERLVLFREIDDFVRACCASAAAARDRWIFWLHYRHGFTTQAISELPAVELTQKGVESLIRRTIQCVRHGLIQTVLKRAGGE